MHIFVSPTTYSSGHAISCQVAKLDSFSIHAGKLDRNHFYLCDENGVFKFSSLDKRNREKLLTEVVMTRLVLHTLMPARCVHHVMAVIEKNRHVALLESMLTVNNAHATLLHFIANYVCATIKHCTTWQLCDLNV